MTANGGTTDASRAPATGTLEEPQVRAMFDRIARRLRPHELGHDGGPAPPLARARRRPRRSSARARARSTSPAAPATSRSSWRAASAPAARSSACDFSEQMLELARAKAARHGRTVDCVEWANALELPFRDDEFDAATVGFGARNFSDLERGLSRDGARRAARRAGRDPRDHDARRGRRCRPFYALWFDRVVPAAGPARRRRRRLHATCPSSVRRFPGPQRAGCDDGATAACATSATCSPPAGSSRSTSARSRERRRRARRAATQRRGRRRGRARRRPAPRRAARARRGAGWSRSRPGTAPTLAAPRDGDDRGRRQAPAPAAGVPRRRRARPTRPRGALVRAAVAVELIHSASSSTTTCSTPPRCAAARRRSSPRPGATWRPRPATCCSRARSPSWPPAASSDEVRALSAAASALAARRAAAARRRLDAGVSARALPAPLRAEDGAACSRRPAGSARSRRRGGAASATRSRAFGRRIGLAFQLLDDVLDVSGPAERTGKARGTDLLDGTVTLPLILARERDPELAQLDLRALRTPQDAEAVCDRIAATGALDGAQGAGARGRRGGAGRAAGAAGRAAARARARRRGRRRALRAERPRCAR